MQHSIITCPECGSYDAVETDQLTEELIEYYCLDCDEFFEVEV